MNKKEYIEDLSKRLKYIPKEDRDDAIAYYTELLGDMDFSDSEDVTIRLGLPKEAAKNIIDECTVKHVEEVKEKKSIKGTGTVIWLAILGILSLPLSLPIAIVLFAVVLVIVITFLGIYIALFATALALVIGGVMMIVLAIIMPGTRILIAGGVGFILIGIGILMGLGLVCAVRGIVRGIGKSKARKEKK